MAHIGPADASRKVRLTGFISHNHVFNLGTALNTTIVVKKKKILDNQKKLSNWGSKMLCYVDVTFQTCLYCTNFGKRLIY